MDIRRCKFAKIIDGDIEFCGDEFEAPTFHSLLDCYNYCNVHHRASLFDFFVDKAAREILKEGLNLDNYLKGKKYKCDNCLSTNVIDKFTGYKHPGGLTTTSKKKYWMFHQCRCGTVSSYKKLGMVAWE